MVTRSVRGDSTDKHAKRRLEFAGIGTAWSTTPLRQPVDDVHKHVKFIESPPAFLTFLERWGKHCREELEGGSEQQHAARSC